jgi:thiol:disulfide interchange protein DsbD
MFGLFEIQVPVFIRSKFGNKKLSHGYVDAYLTGLIAGIVASPCVGPVLVALLAYVAQSQKALLGFLLLFTYAMGLGLIFILMGTFSQLLSKLPKSGPWMIKVKKTFGVILIIMGFYYLLPVLKRSMPSIPNVQTQPSDWAPYTTAAVEGARNKKVVIIDFSAEWCAACHELDKFTFGNLEVKRKMANALLLKVDATQENEHVTPILEKYGVVGLPTIIFIEKDGNIRKDQTLTGFEPPLDFIKRLEKLKTLE